MKFEKICIATARIKGLTKSPYYLEHHGYFAWDIMFYDTSTLMFDNLPCIEVGNTVEEAVNFCNQLKENFKQGNIHDGDKVAVIFKENGHVRAIGRIGQDLWVDVDDKFVKKTFEELDIIITSLKVH